MTVFVLPDGLKGEVQDEMAENPSRFVTIDDFRPKYLEYFKTFRAGLAKALKEPHSLVPSVPLTGGAIADFMPKFADAIIAQEPLNVPSIFERSRNDALNRALIKLKADFTANIDNGSTEDAKPTMDLSRFIDIQMNLLLSDMEISLSYMSPEVLEKLRTDGIDAIKPIKDNALRVNFLKLQSLAASKLKMIEADLEAMMKTEFPPEKLFVWKISLDNSWETLQTSIISKYEADIEGLDRKSALDGWREELSKALTAQKAVLDAGYISFWRRYVENASSKELENLRIALDDLVLKTAAGDSKQWEMGRLVATDAAKFSFNSLLSSEYVGPDVDAVRKSFEVDVDSAAKTRQALWARHDQEVLEELDRRLKRQQDVYSARLFSSLVPERQPPAFEEVINPSAERVSFFEHCNHIIMKTFANDWHTLLRMLSTAGSLRTTWALDPVKTSLANSTTSSLRPRKTFAKIGTMVSEMDFFTSSP